MKKDREKRIDIFEDTINQIKNIEQLKQYTENSKKNTILYKEDYIFDLPNNPNLNGTIKVINSRTFKACNELENVVVLNFASATNPGGGVKTGSKAQEECLCRCSTLYPCLTQNHLFNDFYKYHRDRHNIFYTNRIIYTPNITIFKEDIEEPKLMAMENWYQVDVITSSAPNLRLIEKFNENELLKLLKSRIERIIQIAIVNRKQNIILGAFGCGVFKNPPYLVARAFKEVLDIYRNYFDNIIFAILITDESNQIENNNFNIFSKILQ